MGGLGAGNTRASLLGSTPAEILDLHDQARRERLRRKADMAEAVLFGMAGNAKELIAHLREQAEKP